MTTSVRPSLAGDRTYPLLGGVVIRPYGQFDFMGQRFDDGVSRTDTFVDNSNANTRFGFFVYVPDASFDLQFQFETGLGFRPSSGTSQLSTPDFWDWQRTDVRQMQLVYNGAIGTVRLGQGNMAMDGVAETDLAGTVVVAKSTIPEGAGSYLFRTQDNALSNITMGSTFNNFDGTRRFRVRYDTRPLHGFSIGASYGIEVLKEGVDDHYYDVTLRYAQDFDRIKVKGAVGIAWVHTHADTTHRVAGSLSVLDQQTGMNVTLAAGGDDHNATYLYLKPGWNVDLLEVGTTKFVGELYWGSDFVTDGSKSRMWGLGLIQEVKSINTELYMGYRHFSYDDRTPQTYRDAGLFQIGGRFQY